MNQALTDSKSSPARGSGMSKGEAAFKPVGKQRNLQSINKKDAVSRTHLRQQRDPCTALCQASLKAPMPQPMFFDTGSCSWH